MLIKMEYFTKHGLGKEEICKQTATIIDKLFQTQTICIDWETNETIRRTFQNTDICNDLKNTNRKDNIDSEVNKGNMLKETTDIDDNTKVRTSTSQ
jgi:hypothetical protein